MQSLHLLNAATSLHGPSSTRQQLGHMLCTSNSSACVAYSSSYVRLRSSQMQPGHCISHQSKASSFVLFLSAASACNADCFYLCDASVHSTLLMPLHEACIRSQQVGVTRFFLKLQPHTMQTAMWGLCAANCDFAVACIVHHASKASR